MKTSKLVTTAFIVLSIVIITNSCASTPKIIKTVEKGDSEKVENLIDGGANINEGDYANRTALMHASMKGDVEIVEMLIEAGADVNAVTDTLPPHPDVIIIGIEEQYNCTALMFACGATLLGYDVPEYRNPDIVKMLIEAGANVNVQNRIGGSALMYSSAYGHTEVARILVEAGADITAQANNGYTAMMLAMENGHKEIVGVLVEAIAK